MLLNMNITFRPNNRVKGLVFTTDNSLPAERPRIKGSKEIHFIEKRYMTRRKELLHQLLST